tara:strand:+ start:114 stop:290 length:177 start_codon:yes stop_codon:yes gene_type:complete
MKIRLPEDVVEVLSIPVVLDGTKEELLDLVQTIHGGKGIGIIDDLLWNIATIIEEKVG